MVSIIIAVHNQIGYTKACIESILKNTEIDNEIIVIDNGSTDGTKEYVREEVPRAIIKHGREEMRGFPTQEVNYISNTTNIGATKAWNQGAREAQGDYLMILNNDTLVSKGWLKNLANFIDVNPHIGAVSPQLCGNGELWDQPKPIPGMTPEQFKEANKNGTLPVIERYRWPMHGCFVLIPKKVFRAIGEYDEWYSPGGGEDVDYARRLILAGLIGVTYQNVLCYHYGAVTQYAVGHQVHNMGQAWYKYRTKWQIEEANEDELWNLYLHIQNSRISFNNTRRELGLPIHTLEGKIIENRYIPKK